LTLITTDNARPITDNEPPTADASVPDIRVDNWNHLQELLYENTRSCTGA